MKQKWTEQQLRTLTRIQTTTELSGKKVWEDYNNQVQHTPRKYYGSIASKWTKSSKQARSES